VPAEAGGFTADTGGNGGDSWGSGNGAGSGFDDVLGQENISKHQPADGGRHK